MHSQETFSNSIVDNILSFSMHPHSTYLVKSNQSYHNRENSEEARVSAERWKPVWCRSKVRTSLRIELPEQFGHN
jgi:hypothetical protein